MIRKVSAEDIAIRGNGTGLEYMCPTRHFVYIFFNPVFQVSTAKNEINLFNNHILIVAPVTFAPAGAMTPSAEFLLLSIIVVIPTFFIPMLFFFKKAMEILWTLHLSVHLSICQSYYLLLNSWVEFYQTCYITSTHGKCVHYFSVHAFVIHPFIHLFVTLSLPKPVHGIQPNLLHHCPLI